MEFWKAERSKRDEPARPATEESVAELMAEPLDVSTETPEAPELNYSTPSLYDLLPELQRLDRLLEQAIAVAQAMHGAQAADPFRGLHISQGDVERLLARAPGVPIYRAPGGETELAPVGAISERLVWLTQAFDLTPFEVDVIFLALAPELDLRYERLYAYLQDDVTRRRPSVDLALNLFCTTAEDKLAGRAHFAPEAALVRHDLVHLNPAPNQLQPPLLAYSIKLDEQITGLLLRHENLDPRLAPFCDLVTMPRGLDELPLIEDMKRAVSALVGQARAARQPLRLYFHGPKGSGKRRTAEALAAEAGAQLLVVGLARALAAKTDFHQLTKILFREAWFQDAILYLDGLDVLRGDEQVISYQYLLDALAEDAGITILTGKEPWIPAGRAVIGAITVPFPIPEFAQRRACWQTHLAAADIMVELHDLDAVADRFRLTPSQIAEATATARNNVSLRAASQPYPPSPLMREGTGGSEAETAPLLSPAPTLSDLFAAARAQSGHDLTALAKKIEPIYGWKDIVLPEDTVTQLRELCQRVAHHHRVLGEWGFGQKLSLGKGVNALFAGPSGTGKTMAAEVISNELGLDLYKINLSSVVSKYIGETEKNLERVFTAAENANAILFFDEADALFGKRSEVRDSHDRYANVEISYLLQKMEQYEGLAILATNLPQSLDESFVRRLAFTVHFPFPEEANRRRIWARVWPVETPVAEEVDLDFLARQFKLSGGNIKNIALAAAFLAAEEGDAVSMAHLIRATRREYQKLGKPLTEAELGPFALGASA